MTARPGRRISLLGAALASLTVLSGVFVAGTSPASAASTVTLRVVIEHVDEHGCTDTGSGSDFFSRITIAGQAFDFDKIDGQDEIWPNWTAEKVLDVNSASTAAVLIQLGEYDSGLNFGDDGCDITPSIGTDLKITVNLIPCMVFGGASGPCGTGIYTSGNGSSEGDGDAELTFRVEVDQAASTPGLTVRCLQSPLWPQPGDNVTITVESLDGTVQVGDTMVDTSNATPTVLVDHTKIADSLEIWVGAATVPAMTATSKTTASFVVNNAPTGDLVYSCRVKQGADVAFTGWRRTRVGPPASGKAIPVVYTGERKNRVDIVLIADKDSYTSAQDPNFLSDAADVIKGAYYGQDFFLSNQQEFNFWLADQTGDAARVAAPTAADPSNTNCVITAPGNWGKDYGWRDSGAILHRDTFRDCASGGVFSSEPTSLATALHETGHSPFGLADEYCCDGGYFENQPNPNMLDSLAKCQTDAMTLLRPATDCRMVTDARPTPPVNWFVSDPTPNDLMDSRKPPQGADIRRMNWFFDNCRSGKC